jgi:hypothetical protein
MQLLSTISVHKHDKRAVIELLQGDLSALPAEHAADIVVISAFPGNYEPSPGSLVEALNNKGLSVSKLAEHKYCDLRSQLGCWLSDHLTPAQQEQFNFSHILCFEPLLHVNAPEEVVSNIFRCINTFVFDDDHNVVAMPILATGNQKVPVEKMLPALLENAIFWLEQGLPLNAIKLVVYNEDQLAITKAIFADVKKYYERPPDPHKSVLESLHDEIVEETNGPVGFAGATAAGKPKAGRGGMAQPVPASPPKMESKPAAAATAAAPAATAPPAAPQVAPDAYDYFISYAHKQTDLINSFVQSIRKHNDGLKIFYDRSSIPPGGLWIKHISDAIMKAKKVIVVITPDYCNSPVCWDEFQCAKLIEYNTRKPVIQTLYLLSESALPPIMGIYSYIDCREGDQQKLEDAIKSLAVIPK